jgi:hypothetical protein
MEAWSPAAGNLSEEAASRRLRIGILMLAVSLAMAVAMAAFGLRSEWRLALVLPFFFAANGVYQGLHRA